MIGILALGLTKSVYAQDWFDSDRTNHHEVMVNNPVNNVYFENYAASKSSTTVGNKQTKASMIDIAIYCISCGDFEVRLKPKTTISNNTLTNIQFTIKWPINTTDFIKFQSDFDVSLQGSVITENDTNFAVFVSASPIPISWTAETEYTILSFAHDQLGSGYADILIDTGIWSASNNAAYYVELLGSEQTGIVYQNATNIFLGMCGRVDVKVFLQGPYDSLTGLMNTNINDKNELPLVQPYSDPPWNYNGIENVIIMPSDVVDWILVEFRDAPNAESASSATSINKQAALLLNNGSIVGTDGTSMPEFNNSTLQNLFVTLWFRNHLGILSAINLEDNSEDLYLYDFTTDGSQAHSNGQLLLGNGSYGMIGGDANSDGIIDLVDRIQVWVPSAGFKGYLNGDLNLNGQVENVDKNDLWYNNLFIETHVPD